MRYLTSPLLSSLIKTQPIIYSQYVRHTNCEVLEKGNISDDVTSVYGIKDSN